MIKHYLNTLPVTAYKTEAEQTLVTVSSEIQIDGYYDDWSSYPVTELTYFANNGQSVHTGQIYTDGIRVYVHFAMNDLYTSQIQVQQMSLTLNGETHAIGIYPVKADYSIDWDYYNNEMRSLSNGIHQNFGVIVDYTSYCDSQAAITIYDSTHQTSTKGDEIEFSFSLKDFARITGMNTDHVEAIHLVNPNIGSQSVTWTGTPTGAFFGIIAAVFLACISAYTWFHKKRDDKC